MKALEVARMDQNKQKMPYFHCDPGVREENQFQIENTQIKMKTKKQIHESKYLNIIQKLSGCVISKMK